MRHSPGAKRPRIGDNPDGSEQFFTYNTQGQMTGESWNGDAEPVTFSYNLGAITIIDAAGDKTTEFLDAGHQVSAVIDPLGNVTQASFNDASLPASLHLAGGLSTSIAYDALGNPTRATDPSGNAYGATYDSTFNALQSLTDANGNTLGNSYNASNGNLLATTYPDGSSEQYAYDAIGQVTQFTNRDGQAIGYTYWAERPAEDREFSRRKPRTRSPTTAARTWCR